MRVENEKVIFGAGIKINTIPERNAQRFISTDTTPTVLNNEVWIANNVVPVTVTQFDDGAECQEITVLGDGQTTVANNANIKTNTGANKLLAVNRVYRFIKISTVWYEY